MDTGVPPQFRDLTRFSGVLKACLVVYCVTHLVSAWCAWQQIILIDHIQRGAEYTHEEISSNEVRAALVGGVRALVFFVTAFFFLRWTYLTKKNALALGAKGMTSSPAMSVGWYFVPIATLWKPYEAIKETFMASDPACQGSWQEAARPSFLPIWWALWLISETLWNLSFHASAHTKGVADLGVSTWLELLGGAVDLPLTIVVLVLVSTLQSWQTEKYASRNRNVV